MRRKLFLATAVLLITVFAFSATAFADYYSKPTLLRSGMENTEVERLQRDLKSLGYFRISPTGYFGDYTKQSVIAFQRANNLAVDGIVGIRTARELKVDRVIQTAKQYIGVPYVWGGVSPSGFDCSGYTHYVLLKNGIVVPRTAKAQYGVGTSVSKDQLKPGDLVFFETYAPGPTHVGFYIGNNQFLHASSGGDSVKISDMTKSYYAQRYIGAKRVI